MPKNPSAVALGRRGGLARAAKETAAERSERMRAVVKQKPLKCDCGECRTCKARAYQRKRRSEK